MLTCRKFFCTQYRKENCYSRLGGGVCADAIMDRKGIVQHISISGAHDGTCNITAPEVNTVVNRTLVTNVNNTFFSNK